MGTPSLLIHHGSTSQPHAHALSPSIPHTNKLLPTFPRPRPAMPKTLSHPQPAVQASTIFQPNLFKGKVIFVTGGSSGICYGQTEAMMGLGCDAAIFGRRLALAQSSAKAMEQKTGRKCLPLNGDVRNYEDLVKAVEKTVQEYGKIDYVICGAAGNFLSAVEALSPNAFKTALPELRKTKGSIIAVSATLQVGATHLQAHASAAKAGVDTLIRNVCVEYGPFGIRANTIAPGPIANTEGLSRLTAPAKKGTKVAPEYDNAQAATNIPAQRLGELDDISNATAFLFSPAASYITGAHLVVDGGEHYLKIQNTMLEYPEIYTEQRDFRPASDKSKL